MKKKGQKNIASAAELDEQAQFSADVAAISEEITVEAEEPKISVEAAENSEINTEATASYESEIAAALAGESEGSYVDLFIEEFSAEHQAHRVAAATKIPAKISAYIVAVIYFVVGVLCVAITEHVIVALPYIVGGLMTLFGLVGFIISLVKHEYRTLKTNKTATSLIAMLLGVMILVEQFDPESDPIMLISIVWGILGLIEGAHAFNVSFKRMSESRRFAYFLLKGIVECAVAFILLYKPESESAHFLHIVVFGVNLMIDAIIMIPQVKSFLTAE